MAIRSRWGDELVVSHGVIFHPHALSGVVAELGDTERVGLATFTSSAVSCELVTLDSFREHQGIGSALVKAVAQQAADGGCSRLWCITTNDNLPALRFYQRLGFRIVAVHPGAVQLSRLLKPSIPQRGIDGIPINDEIELELLLTRQ